MTETVVNEPALPSVFARAIGIITSPKATFELVVRSPRSIGILALVALLSGFGASAYSLTENGRQAQIDFSIAQNEKFGIPMDDAAIARVEKMAPYTIYATVVGMFVGLPILVIIVSGIFYAIFNAIMGGTATFKQIMAVASHSWMIPALGALFAGAMNFARGSISQSAANLGMLLPMLPEGSFAANLAGAIDVFQIWFVITLSIGLAVLYKRKTSGVAITLFSIYGVIAICASYFLRKG